MSIKFGDFKSTFQKEPVEEFPNNVLSNIPDPVVTVRVKAYQHAPFIRDCLEGILMQKTTFPFEVLLGEDESTDGTRDICKQYANEYPNKIRLFLNSRANNIKINGLPTGRFFTTFNQFVARGKYIAICEGDDFWTDPYKLQKQVDYLETHPETVVSYHDSFLINKEGVLLDFSDIKGKHKKDYCRNELQGGAHMATASMCYRNVISHFPPEYFRALNGDAFITSMLGLHGNGKFHHDIKASAYRIHTGGIHSSGQYAANKEASAHTRYILASYYKRIGDYDSFEKLLGNYKERLTFLLNFYARHAGIKKIIATYWKLQTRCFSVMDPREIASISAFSIASLIEAIRSKIKS